MAKKKITVDQLVSHIDREISNANQYNSKVQNERNKALKYFYKDPYGNEKRGRSTYISSEVQETISWALPQIMKIFSGKDIIKFTSSNPNYKDSAALATQYCETVLNKHNPGFLILHNFFHDALLQKNGFLKVFFDKEDQYEVEEYEKLSDAELTILLQDQNVEPIEHESYQEIDPMTGAVISSTHDIKVKRKMASEGGNIRIENIPVEEVIVSKTARSLDLDQASFIAHRVKRSISWLREQGYKIPDDINDGVEQTTDYSLEKLTREQEDGNYYSNQLDMAPIDPSMRMVWVTEAYLRVDFNNDGIAELRKITKVGSTVLVNEEVYCQPFISTSPFPQPHKFNGQSLADLVLDLQLLKSMVMRAMLDSFAFNINPSKAVNIDKIVDVNDLLDTNPGNFIRMRGDINGAITTLPSSGIGGEAFSLLNYIDDISESRSGVSKSTQGLDKNAFNKTATGTQILMTASQEKLALIVRVLAETGLGPLYKKIVELASKYSDGPELIEMNSQYVNVYPIEWRHLKNIDVNVGTGSLDLERETANLNAILQMQQQLQSSQQPELMSMIDPMKIYNGVSNVVKSMGFNSANEFFNTPGGQEYLQMNQYIQQKMQAMQQPPIDPNASLAEAEKIKSAQDLMIKTADFELNKLKADRDFELKKYEMQLKYELELMKLEASTNNNTDISMNLMEDQLAQVGQLNPSNELLSESEINTITQVISNQGSDPSRIPLYQQRLQEKDAMKRAAEMEKMQQQAQNNEMYNAVQELTRHIAKPKQVVRDQTGKIIGITTGE